jgi:hypothetical protein
MCVFNGCYRAATANLPFAISPGVCFYRCTDGSTCCCVLFGRGPAAECAINICSDRSNVSENDQRALAEEALAMAMERNEGQAREEEQAVA